MNFLSYIIVS